MLLPPSGFRFSGPRRSKQPENNMKKINIALMLALALGYSASAFAGSSVSTASVPVTAGVDQVLTLDMTIKPELAGGGLGAAVTSMPYTLVRNGANALGGDKAYHVFLGTNTSARAYTVKSTVGALTSSGNTLPNAWGVFPAPVTDGTADITGDTPLAAADTAIGTDKLVYTSNSAGKGAVIELVYGISAGNPAGQPAPFTGWTPIPPDQASGTYTASPALTFTLTTNV
jgi:hypothetical protein